ncbi:hypothetical protein C5167_048885 [Papaver somniferum]|uniref:Auxin-responsive protein n=1 Tax=Papaver somniferum TaxID=3469 RepID=A0A4Y7KJ84_PAPSO|nr:hypothetical protein C5167_048885 [Papaver somniferum]
MSGITNEPISPAGSSSNDMFRDVSSEVSAMYIKVHMVGCPIGRRINIKAHDNYESLRQALHKLSDNFLSVNYLDAEGIPDNELEDVTVTTKGTLFISENHEGGRGIGFLEHSEAVVYLCSPMKLEHQWWELGTERKTRR